MIEYYLTTLRRAGALQGAKTEYAFFVKAGLGETMTAADMQIETMIIEIGLASRIYHHAPFSKKCHPE
jgi:phage tail sheath protein FI